MADPVRESWIDCEPAALEREHQAMATHATGMEWRTDLHYHQRPVVGWVGEAPVWGADRPMPAGVPALLDGSRLQLQVLYPEAFPMVAPALLPIEPSVPIARRTLHTWHVNGDGTLCLMQRADDWQPLDTAADLVCKAAGWYIEYRLIELGHREKMTESGIFLDAGLDELLEGIE